MVGPHNHHAYAVRPRKKKKGSCAEDGGFHISLMQYHWDTEFHCFLDGLVFTALYLHFEIHQDNMCFKFTYACFRQNHMQR